MTDESSLKSAVTIAEMARMVGLSRARFNQLIGTAFPFPLYDVKTRRPFYTEDQQRVCLEVRRRNCGVDGKPILFYARRLTAAAPAPKPAKVRAPKQKDDELIESIKALGLTTATSAQIEAAVKELFPNGVNGTNQGEVIRAVFLRLRRKDSRSSEE